MCRCVARAVRVGPVPIPAVLADEPAEVGEQVGADRRDEERAERGQSRSGRSHRAIGRRTPADLERAAVPHQASSANSTKNDSAVHFTAQARPSSTPAASRHGRGPSVGMPPARSAPSAISPPAGRASGPGRARGRRRRRARTNCRKMSRIAVRASTSDSPSSAISSAGDAAEQVGPEHPARDAGDQDDGQAAERSPGNAAPAANATVSLSPNSADVLQRDQPLAQRRMHDEHVAAVVLVAVAQQLLRLGRVVGLVEDLARSGSRAPRTG